MAAIVFVDLYGDIRILVQVFRDKSDVEQLKTLRPWERKWSEAVTSRHRTHRCGKRPLLSSPLSSAELTAPPALRAATNLQRARHMKKRGWQKEGGQKDDNSGFFTAMLTEDRRSLDTCRKRRFQTARQRPRAPRTMALWEDKKSDTRSSQKRGCRLFEPDGIHLQPPKLKHRDGSSTKRVRKLPFQANSNTNTLQVTHL